MKQVTQRLRNGAVDLLDVPQPVLTPETVLVDVRASLLSVGTERAKIQAGKSSMVGKARARPDQVAQVVERARREGVVDTVRAVRARLDQPSPLGYSAAGVVLGVGALARGVAVGDRVAIGGGEQAVHAEIDRVSPNLCVRLPDSVSFEEGCFACIGSVALHGVRQAGVSIGERVAVIGLGLVGQLSGLLLRAAGCTVVGVDVDAGALEAALSAGAVDVGVERQAIGEIVPGDAAGCDAVILTAATQSNDPIELAPRLCRDRGRVVVVGDVGLAVPRAAYYEKEIDLRLSRSYGPGRYDRAYEQHGRDYPIGYVRWTEGRNMQAIVELIGAGRLPVARLISSRVPLDDAPGALDRLATEPGSPLGVVIEYPASPLRLPPPEPVPRQPLRAPDRVSVIGAGSFAQRILIPGLRDAGFTIDTVASGAGLSAVGAAERAGEGVAGTVDEALASAAGVLAIATTHSSHAELAIRGLRAGKLVFMEKPPCLSWEELEELRAALQETGGTLFVGFNRRHAPLARKLHDHLAGAGHPRQILIRVNAGALPRDHWVNDADDGGGRLLGEGCHFVDLACWLAGALPTSVRALIQPAAGEELQTTQRFVISLGFADGSLATLLYTDGGASGLRKEYVEAHAGGRSAVLDDYRRLELFDGRSRRELRDRRGDKGHGRQFSHLLACARGGSGVDEEPSPLDSMAVTLAALDAGRKGLEIAE
jgi:predicted dehydrogenase/threonine dehydrogenase-like Zn-dependent dehydrogenase